MRLPYLEFEPTIAEPARLALSAVVTGRTTVGPGLVLDEHATLRADGEAIRIGTNGYFGRRATVHIAEDVYPAIVGDDVTVGRYGLVHACTLDDGVLVGDAATVMDGIGRRRARAHHARIGGATAQDVGGRHCVRRQPGGRHSCHRARRARSLPRSASQRGSDGSRRAR